MPNQRSNPGKGSKRVVFYPGLKELLWYEGERFMAEGGKPVPPAVYRYLDVLVSAVLKPKELLACAEGTKNARDGFAKTYARNPEVFLGLMIHLTSYYSKLRRNPIKLALRENSEITVWENGCKITKPINRASEKELMSFVETNYTKVKSHKTVSRCRERLAEDDSKLPANERLVRNALRIFAEHIRPETWALPVPADD